MMRSGLVVLLASAALLVAPVALGPGAGLTSSAAFAKEETRVEAAGKVVSGAGNKRRLQVKAGPVELTVHVPSNTWIEREGKKISVHEVKAGTYIRATGKRIGNTRMEADHIWVIGDRHDFLESSYGKPAGEKGYVKKM
jgi:hypothetical protein